MRKKKAIINTCFSLLLELASVLSGFVIPNIIIRSFGSDINGLCNSITSFLGYISILQLGAGSAIKASLYKPLAKKDHDALNKIVKASSTFFTRIGLAGILYMAILFFIFPVFFFPDNGFIFSSSLVVIIGLGTIAQYLLGITYQMVLEADQRSFIYSSAQIITIILNTISVVILTRLGCSIQIVKLFSACFLIIRPIIVGFYVRRKYNINLHVKYDSKVLSQRWDGFAHGLAFFIHNKTDVFVLTIFSSMANVSVYGVYATITNGISALISSIDRAVRAAFGNMIANDEKENLKKKFSTYNSFIQTFASVCFATAAITAGKFISIYVKDVTDADYYQPLFAILIITAEMFYCLRLPYNGIVFAGNRFKDTKVPAIIEAGINIALSISLVNFFGLIGVAIGTLSAMIYRTISFIRFLHKNILNLDYIGQIKRFAITLSAYAISVFSLSQIDIKVSNYLTWAIYAGACFIACAIINVSLNYLFDRTVFKNVIKEILGKKAV
ncbi:MAG: sugar isomerase [Clostridiales bacterium]|nr:sugar isomerase [Clostridiales bacterium]